MEPQGPYQGFSPSSYGAPAPTLGSVQPLPAQPLPMLRPLSTGEVLDRTLALYRSRFWLFAGIGSGAAVIATLSSAIRLLFLGGRQSMLFRTPGSDPAAAREALHSLGRMQIYFLPLSLVFLAAYGISKAATVFAVTEISEGRTTTVVDAYRAVTGRWLRWFGLVLRQYWALAWPMIPGFGLFAVVAFGAALLFRNHPAAVGVGILLAMVFVIGGLALGVINYLRVALAEPAAVIENLGVNASVRRSRFLVADRKGRIFLAVLLVYALYMVAGGLELPFLLMAQTSRGAAHAILLAGQLVVGFIATSLVLPVASIAFTLFYIDERVRREGYDIERMLPRNVAGSSVQEP